MDDVFTNHQVSFCNGEAMFDKTAGVVVPNPSPCFESDFYALELEDKHELYIYNFIYIYCIIWYIYCILQNSLLATSVDIVSRSSIPSIPPLWGPQRKKKYEPQVTSHTSHQLVGGFICLTCSQYIYIYVYIYKYIYIHIYSINH